MNIGRWEEMGLDGTFNFVVFGTDAHSCASHRKGARSGCNPAVQILRFNPAVQILLFYRSVFAQHRFDASMLGVWLAFLAFFRENDGDAIPNRHLGCMLLSLGARVIIPLKTSGGIN